MSGNRRVHAAAAIGRCLTLVLVALLALLPVAMQSDGALGVGPGRSVESGGAAAGPRAQRSHRDRGSKRDRVQDRGGKQLRGGPSERELSRVGKGFCDEPGDIWLPEALTCTHGPDPVPPGFDADRVPPPVSARTARAAMAAFQCDGDGVTGPRVRILYARPSNVTSRFAAYRASFQTWASQADTVMRNSATMAGGERRFRFYTGSDCVPGLNEVVLDPIPAGADADFSSVVAQLKAQGWNRTDRKYLVYLDAKRTGVCGTGTRWSDDRPDTANLNNFGPSYAVVFNTCWASPRTDAHELMHNLGGVQRSAPHTDLGGHCVDEYDRMCYRGSPNSPPLIYPCPDQARYDQLFDCGNDDYFDPTPLPGSYLATHWNTANNQFLVGGVTAADVGKAHGGDRRTKRSRDR